eukprot:1175597-Prorocentrum_minimum.AAC.2
MAVCRQGIYVEYSAEYSKRRALNGMLVSTVDDCRRIEVEGLFGRRLPRGLTYTYYIYAHYLPDSKSGIVAEKHRLAPKVAWRLCFAMAAGCLTTVERAPQ